VRRLLLLPLLLVAGCGTSADADHRFTVVATTPVVADLVRNVTGPGVRVQQILAPNADPHEYELRPHDVQAVADADLVVRSGGDVDDWIADAIEGSGTHARVVDLIDGVERLDDDPHWWQSPRQALRAVGEIRRALGARADARAYSARLQRLDRDVAACIDKVPSAQRKLVTSHDAFGYYAREFGIDVVGAVIPSLSTEGQPSAGDTADLIATIRRTGVRTIFPESSINPKVEAAIAQETGARVGRALWADTLGPAGSDGATYVQAVTANTRALADGFAGHPVGCNL
jgi:ABC-type Zn uptake system ZnuABC Zn-binding protein ZnuA